jgi:hypothetical protein
MTRKTTPTYVLLNQITLAAASSSVTFANIPQGYGDLIVQGVAPSSSTGTGVYFRYNSDTGSNYSYVRAFGTGSSTGSTNATETSGLYGVHDTTSGAFTLQIMDYAQTDKHKTALSRADGVTQNTNMIATRWANTAAITTISLSPESFSGNRSFAIGSTFSLYGIVA